MAAPTRGSEETLVTDATSLPNGETTFDWDLSSAWYGEITFEVTFPSSGYGDVTIYDCPTAVNSPATGDYPAQAQGRVIGYIPSAASTTLALTASVSQGVHRIRIANAGSTAATLAKCRGRKYT